MYSCSADATFHANRGAFHDELFDVLSPILSSPDVRADAARGIYGGELPYWYKDLMTEKEAKESNLDESNKLSGASADLDTHPSPPASVDASSRIVAGIEGVGEESSGTETVPAQASP